MQDTFDGSEGLVNGLYYADQVKHVLMSVGMNYPLERILLFCPIFWKGVTGFTLCLPCCLCTLYAASHVHSMNPKFLLHRELLKEISPELKHIFVKFRLETGHREVHSFITLSRRHADDEQEFHSLTTEEGGHRIGYFFVIVQSLSNGATSSLTFTNERTIPNGICVDERKQFNAVNK